MFNQLSKQVIPGIFLGLILTTMPVLAVQTFKISNYGGGHQIWFEAEDFDERNPDSDQYYPVVDQADAFGQAITRTGEAGGMIRWTFNIDSAGGTGGTWYFWARQINPSNSSDYMLVEGDPDDPAIPTGPPFPGGSSSPEFADGDDRVFEIDVGPSWGWDQSWGTEGHTKELQDGLNTMYIFHRQGNSTVFWDVFVWADDPDYVPTDDDYENATVFFPGKATNPSPANQATEILRDVILSWRPGESAAATNGHKLFFSENFNEVDERIGGITQTPSSYTPPELLDFGTTYYWRVDELSAPPDSTVFDGVIWSFTTELFAYPIENIVATASSSDAGKGPENTVNGSGLDGSELLHGNIGVDTMWMSSLLGDQPTWIEYEFDKVYKLHEMWVWNSNESLEQSIGFGCKDVVIEYSANGIDLTTLGTTHEFARAPGTADYEHNTTIDFAGAPVKFVRLTVNSNWGGILNQFGLSEVRFFSIPVQAREPDPTSGATDVELDLILGFRAGREAASHNVYFSDDQQAVIDGTAPVTTVTETSHGPLALDLGKTYYWRVDEVNDAQTPSSWLGDVWDFTTQEYFVVDDFESYNDLNEDEPGSNRIYLAWIDGYDNPAVNGSIVGHANPPFAERTIVHSGSQSMPFFYDNSVGNSEATMTLSSRRDWTLRGSGDLSLWFYGDASNSAEPMYVAIANSTGSPAVVYHDEPAATQTGTWTEWIIDFQVFADQGVDLTNVNTMTIGFGNRNNPTAGGTGMVFFDDIRLYRPAP